MIQVVGYVIPVMDHVIPSLLPLRFLAKCSDFFYWFVSSHLKRVEFNPHFPVLEFLGLFYKYTFKQVSQL